MLELRTNPEDSKKDRREHEEKATEEMNDDEQAEVVNFECRDCGEEFDLLLWPNDFDRCIKETGHDGHRWVICEYVQIQGNPWINATTK